MLGDRDLVQAIPEGAPLLREYYEAQQELADSSLLASLSGDPLHALEALARLDQDRPEKGAEKI
jgi:hypothetical protein